MSQPIRNKRPVFDPIKGGWVFFLYPFVCLIKPFVGYTTTRILPFIGHIIPFIGNARKPRGLRSLQSGFTLIELAITLVIFALVAAIALPSFQRTLLNNTTTADANGFLQDLNYARSEAVKRGRPIKICVSNAAQSACDLAGNWATAGRLVVDEATLPPMVLRVSDPLGNSRTLREPANGYTAVTFIPDGRVLFEDNGGPEANTGITAVFATCHKNDTNQGRDIRVSPTGNIKVIRPATAC